MTAADEAFVAGVGLGLLLVAAGEEAFVAVGELSGFGVGEAVFSVVTDTLGSSEDSDFSGGVISGEDSGAGVEVSS
jgi:hypothetical protein